MVNCSTLVIRLDEEITYLSQIEKSSLVIQRTSCPIDGCSKTKLVEY
jgi:hypothetical protein